MVKLQHELVTKGLGLTHLKLVMGTSMGAMHAWDWGYMYPTFASGLVPLASNPVEIAGRNRIWRKFLFDAIEKDPSWRGGEYTEQPIGMRSAIGFLMMAHMNSPEGLVKQAKLMESYGANCIYVTDSAGYMLPDDVTVRLQAVRAALKPETELGFHGHHNLAMGVANSVAAVAAGAGLVYVVSTSITRPLAELTEPKTAGPATLAGSRGDRPGPGESRPVHPPPTRSPGLRTRADAIPLGLGTLQPTPFGAFGLNVLGDLGPSGGLLVQARYLARFRLGRATVYPELGMEAIWRIEVENFPAFIVIDDKGNDFFKELNLG